MHFGVSKNFRKSVGCGDSCVQKVSFVCGLIYYSVSKCSPCFSLASTIPKSKLEISDSVLAGGASRWEMRRAFSYYRHRRRVITVIRQHAAPVQQPCRRRRLCRMLSIRVQGVGYLYTAATPRPSSINRLFARLLRTGSKVVSATLLHPPPSTPPFLSSPTACCPMMCNRIGSRSTWSASRVSFQCPTSSRYLTAGISK